MKRHFFSNPIGKTKKIKKIVKKQVTPLLSGFTVK
jgi:hypothetical protein